MKLNEIVDEIWTRMKYAVEDIFHSSFKLIGWIVAGIIIIIREPKEFFERRRRKLRTMTGILKDFWFRLKWKGKFVIGILMMACGDLKQFFEITKKKGGA